LMLGALLRTGRSRGHTSFSGSSVRSVKAGGITPSRGMVRGSA